MIEDEKEVCVNCKNIIPHVHEYIDGEWKYGWWSRSFNKNVWIDDNNYSDSDY